MTSPAVPQNALQDPDDVQFQWADDLEVGTGYTPQEVDAILSVPLVDVDPGALTAAASPLDEGEDDDEGDATDGAYHDSLLVKLQNDAMVTLSEAYGSDRGLREYWTHGEGAAKIRWNTDGDFTRCVRHLSKYVRNPEGLCNEYHREATGKAPHAHPGRPTESVEAEGFAMTSVEPVARPGSDNPMSVAWEGTLAVEGTETGDGRMFSNGSLIWPDLPIPLMYQYITSHGGSTDKSTNVGNITEVWREGKFIKGRGTIDVSDPFGMQAARKMRGQYLRGVSIDADGVKNSDVELVYPQPDAGMDTNDPGLADLFGTPELTIFHAGRIRGATLVNLPAFVEASLNLTGDTSVLDIGATAMVASGGVRKYIRDKLGRFDDKPGGSSKDTSHLPHVGDGPAAPTLQERLAKATPEELDRYYRAMEGGGDPDERPTYNEDDEYGLTRPARDVADTIYDDDSDTIDESELPDLGDNEGAKRKRRRYIEGDYNVSVITAAGSNGRRGYTIEIPELPPIAFFQEPVDLPPIGAVWIEPNGHFWGLVGPSSVPHRAYKNKRVTIPMGNVDYTAWMNRPTPVIGPDGDIIKIRTGVITMNCGHLMDFSITDQAARMQHYDNSCSIAAVVRIGESRQHKAPWVSGVIMPMSTEDFQRFQACQLSGDWTPHRQRRGWKEFVASLAVPVPGFARSTNVAAVKLDDNSVVTASSVPILLAESTYDEEPMDAHPDLASAAVESNRLALGRIRARIGASNRQSLADIMRRVQTGASPLTASAATATPVKEGRKTVGCAPCAAKRQRGDTSAQQETPPIQVEGFGDGDGTAAAQKSAENAIANSRGTSRG